MTDSFVFQAILVMAAITFLLRSVPFMLPRKLIDRPMVQMASQFIPLVVMTILVVHAFDGAGFGLGGTAMPIAAGIMAVALLHLSYGNTFLSIVGGVAVHILLLTLV